MGLGDPVDRSMWLEHPEDRGMRLEHPVDGGMRLESPVDRGTRLDYPELARGWGSDSFGMADSNMGWVVVVVGAGTYLVG